MVRLFDLTEFMYSFKYSSSKALSCKDIGISIFEFVAKTQLYQFIKTNK